MPVLFRDILLDPARSDGAFDLVIFILAVRVCEAHEKIRTAFLHFRSDTGEVVSIFAIKIALNAFGSGFLCHPDMKRSTPGCVMIFVANKTILRFDVIFVSLSLSRTGMLRTKRNYGDGNRECDKNREDHGFNE